MPEKDPLKNSKSARYSEETQSGLLLPPGVSVPKPNIEFHPAGFVRGFSAIKAAKDKVDSHGKPLLAPLAPDESNSPFHKPIVKKETPILFEHQREDELSGISPREKRKLMARELAEGLGYVATANVVDVPATRTLKERVASQVSQLFATQRLKRLDRKILQAAEDALVVEGVRDFIDKGGPGYRSHNSPLRPVTRKQQVTAQRLETLREKTVRTLNSQTPIMNIHGSDVVNPTEYLSRVQRRVAKPKEVKQHSNAVKAATRRDKQLKNYNRLKTEITQAEKERLYKLIEKHSRITGR